MAELKKFDQFQKAEALGHTKPMPKSTTEIEEAPEAEIPAVITDISDYQMAHATAAMEDGSGSVEVSPEIFKKLLRGNKENIAMGSFVDRGVRVFVEGRRDTILKEESMNAEAYGNLVARRAAGLT